jgi:hypothetical protein
MENHDPFRRLEMDWIRLRNAGIGYQNHIQVKRMDSMTGLAHTEAELAFDKHSIDPLFKYVQ